MAVHMVRVLCEPPKGEAETAVANWVENYTEWTDDTADHTLVETNAELDGSGTQYVRGEWRFVQNGEEPTNILEDLSNRLQQIQGGLWHRLVYHECSHDEEQSTLDCSWSDQREWTDKDVAIPEDIPVFESGN